MGKIKIDKTDRKILKILQTRGKITNSRLSGEVGLSPAPTLDRVKKLETVGVIKSYHASLNAEMLGLCINTFVMVSLKDHSKPNINEFVYKIKDIDEVMECHHITGSEDFILRVIAKDIASYQKLMLEKVSDIGAVAGLQSMVILSTFKNSKIIPIPTPEDN